MTDGQRFVGQVVEFRTPERSKPTRVRIDDLTVDQSTSGDMRAYFWGRYA